MPTQGSSSSSSSITTTTTTTSISTPTDMAKQQPQLKQVEQKRFIKRYRTEVAASASSVLSTLATFPLDSVKTRMQTYKYSGFVDCVRHTYETEKLRGFFRGQLSPPSSYQVPSKLTIFLGVTAPLASITLVRTVSFSIYQRSKYVYSDWLKRKFGIDVLGHVNKRGTYPSLASVACFGAAGATAGSCITLIACAWSMISCGWLAGWLTS